MTKNPELKRNEIKQIWNAWQSFEPKDGYLETKLLRDRYRNMENCKELQK